MARVLIGLLLVVFSLPAGRLLTPVGAAAASAVVTLKASSGPPTTVTTVTKIEVKDLPADTFVVPKEFTEQHLQPAITMMPGGMLKRPIMPPSAPAGAAPATGAPAPM